MTLMDFKCTRQVFTFLKLYLIQSIDRKLLLEDISGAKGMTLDELISEELKK